MAQAAMPPSEPCGTVRAKPAAPVATMNIPVRISAGWFATGRAVIHSVPSAQAKASSASR